MNTDQTRTKYYKDIGTKKIYNQTEYNQYKEDFVEIFRRQVVNNLYLKEFFIDSVITNDSIIKSFKLTVILEQEKEKVYDFLNKELPNLLLHTIDGKTLELNDLKGKPTVINVWLTTCKPCIEEIPKLNLLKAKYDSKVNFISITRETYEVARKFLNKHDSNFIKVVDATNLIDTLGISAYPKNILIDKYGIIKKIEGGLSKCSEAKLFDEIEEYINELLE